MKARRSGIQRLLLKTLLPAAILVIGVHTASAQRTTAVAKGEWGGSEIAMTVTDSGASIQFDCANANITTPLRSKRDGSFVAEGTMTRNGPGPVRIDAQGRPVTIKGKVTIKTLTFHVSDSKTGESLGDFTVTQGQSSQLHRCY